MRSCKIFLQLFLPIVSFFYTEYYRSSSTFVYILDEVPMPTTPYNRSDGSKQCNDSFINIAVVEDITQN